MSEEEVEQLCAGKKTDENGHSIFGTVAGRTCDSLLAQNKDWNSPEEG